MKNTGFRKLSIEEANAKQQEYDERYRNKPKSKAAIEGKKRSKQRRARLDRREEEFRLKVRAREGYKCQWPGCNYRDKWIPVHHKNERSQRPDEKYNTANGACLCQEHHDYAHHTVEGRRLAKEYGLLGGETYELAIKRKDGREDECT